MELRPRTSAGSLQRGLHYVVVLLTLVGFAVLALFVADLVSVTTEALRQLGLGT